jgi:CRP-like cAMP-binding protein
LSYPVSNVLIDSLPEESRNKLLKQLRPVALPIKATLYEPEDTPRHIHFVTSGIASIVASMLDGGTTEVATVGREGLPQGIHLLGPSPLPTRCFMQIAGHGLRMEFNAFEDFYSEDPEIRKIVLAYAQYQCLMISQIAGCNRLHDVEGRLARWLLIVQDRTGAAVLKLTQEFLAQMIGSRRTTVTAVAGALQDHGLISYSRGAVRVLNRVGLERASCECYPITRVLLRSLYQPSGQKIFGDE